MKADRNKDGEISSWERTVGNAVAKSMREQKAAELTGSEFYPVGEGRITYEDVQKMKMRDMKIITDLLSKAGDVGDDDEDEFPNE